MSVASILAVMILFRQETVGLSLRHAVIASAPICDSKSWSRSLFGSVARSGNPLKAAQPDISRIACSKTSSLLSIL